MPIASDKVNATPTVNDHADHHNDLADAANAATDHIADEANPHGVTKAQVGLGNVTNDAQIPLAQKGEASGVATLGVDGIVPEGQLPPVESGSGAILPWTTATAYIQGEPVTNGGHTYTANDAHTSGATFAGDLAGHWTLLPVTKADVNLANVDNTSDANKPVSTAQAAADGLRALKTNNASDFASAPTVRRNLAVPGIYNGDVTKELTASLTGDLDVRASLGVLNDDLYMAASSGVSAGLHGVKRLQKGASSWETLTTFGASIGIAPGMAGAIPFRGKLYFGGWGATPGAIYRLDLNGDKSFSAFTTMSVAAGAEDAHPGYVLWDNLWINTYANAAQFASSGIGAGLWRWDGVAATAVQVISSTWLGANSFANSQAFYQGRLWVSIVDFTSVYGEIWSVGPDFVPRLEWRGHAPYAIAVWDGELVAMKGGTANSPLYVWRNGRFIQASPASSSGGVALDRLCAVGNRLFVQNYYTGPMEYKRDGSFTQVVLPANTATGHGSPVLWDGALWWLTTQGEQCVFRLPIGQDAYNEALFGRQHTSGGLGLIVDKQIPRVSRDLVIDTAAAGFVQKGTAGRYHRLSLASGAAVVSDLNYSAPNPDAPYAPACTAQPTVTGTTTVGNTLTCTAGTWTNIAVTGVASTDLFTAANHGLVAGSRVSFSGLTGGAGITPGTVYYVIASGLTADAFKVSTTAGGAALNFTTDLSAGTYARIGYQWYRDGVAIPGATANTRLLSVADGADGGHSLVCVVTASNEQGWAAADSNASAVTPAAPPVEPSVTLGANLYAHYRAQDEAGADGAVLAQATDLSGGARHLTQGTVGKRALKKTAIVNGKAVYRFDGVDDRFTRDLGSVKAQTLEIYVVCKMRSAAVAGRLVIGDFGGGRCIASHGLSGSVSAYAGSLGCEAAGSTSQMSDAFHAWGFKFAGASSQVVKDGTVLVTGDAGAGGLQYLSIGADAVDGSIADIDIAEIVIADVALSAPQRAALVYYFQSTYATP